MVEGLTFLVVSGDTGENVARMMKSIVREGKAVLRILY